MMQFDKLNGSHNNPIVENKHLWLFDRLNQRETDDNDMTKQNRPQIQVKIDNALTEQNVGRLWSNLLWPRARLLTFRENRQSF